MKAKINFFNKEIWRRFFASRNVGREKRKIRSFLFKKTPAALHSGQFSIFLMSGGGGRKPYPPQRGQTII